MLPVFLKALTNQVLQNRCSALFSKMLIGVQVTHDFSTNRDLLDMTCRIANVLKKHDIKKGDTVVLYMPAFPLTVASMLACTRIGAVHWYECCCVYLLDLTAAKIKGEGALYKQNIVKTCRDANPAPV